MKNKPKFLTLMAVSAFTFAAAMPAHADEPATYGPGMMRGNGLAQGGYGPGMMGEYGRSQGAYGPGMMQGYGPGGYGPGRGGYGHGMMGGYGDGGMMGGLGAGMRGFSGPWNLLNLSEQQRSKVNQIRDDLRRKNWGVMGQMLDEQARMRDLLSAEKRDPAAIGKQSMKIADLRRQMLEASVDANNRIEALLSKEQKEQMQNFRHGWMMNDD